MATPSNNALQVPHLSLLIDESSAGQARRREAVSPLSLSPPASSVGPTPWSAAPPSPSLLTTVESLSIEDKLDVGRLPQPSNQGASDVGTSLAGFAPFLERDDTVETWVNQLVSSSSTINSKLEATGHLLASIDHADFKPGSTPILPEWQRLLDEFKSLLSQTTEFASGGLASLLEYRPHIVSLLAEGIQAADTRESVDFFVNVSARPVPLYLAHRSQAYTSRDCAAKAEVVNNIQFGSSDLADEIGPLQAKLKKIAEAAEELRKKEPFATEDIQVLQSRLKKKKAKRLGPSFTAGTQATLTEKQDYLGQIHNSLKALEELHQFITPTLRNLDVFVEHLAILIVIFKTIRQKYLQLHQLMRHFDPEELDMDLMKGDVKLIAGCSAVLEFVLKALA